MRENRRYHDRAAARYDEVYDTEYWRFYREISWRHLKRSLPAARPARGADLGCGTGWFGLRLLRAGLATLFLDPSGNMLGKAKEAAAAEAGRGLPCDFVQAGLEDMGAVADQSLDFATAQGDPLSFCADTGRALRELRRVLRPEAWLVLSVDNRAAGVRTLLDEDAADAALELLATGRTQWRAERAGERFPMHMFDAAELTVLLERHGFEVQSRIGKTCLVQRRHESLLANPESRRRWLAAEESVHAELQWWAGASHLQFAARRA